MADDICTVYVGNLTSKADELALRSVFETCGDVKMVNLAGRTGYRVIFAFVRFANASCARTALAMDGLQVGEYPIRVSMAKQNISQNGQSSSRPPAGDRRHPPHHHDRAPRQRDAPAHPSAHPQPSARPDLERHRRPSRADLERPRQHPPPQQPALANSHGRSGQPGQTGDLYRGSPRNEPCDSPRGNSRDSHEGAVAMDEDLLGWEQRPHPGAAQEPVAKNSSAHSLQAASISGAPALEQQQQMLPPLNRSPPGGRGVPSMVGHSSDRHTTAAAAKLPAAPALEELALMTDDNVAAMHGWDIRRPTDRRRIADFRRETVQSAIAQRQQPPTDDVIHGPQQQLPQLTQHHVTHVARDRLPPLAALPETGGAFRGAPVRHNDSNSSGSSSRGGGGGGRRLPDGRRLNQEGAPLSERELAEINGRGTAGSQRPNGSGLRDEERQGRPRESREEGDRSRLLAAGRGRGAARSHATPREGDHIRIPCTVVVEGIQPGVSEREVADWFANEGRVVAVRLSCNGKAWVEFSLAEEAAAALARFAKVQNSDSFRVYESRTAIRSNGLVPLEGSSSGESPSRRGLPAGGRGGAVLSHKRPSDRSLDRGSHQGGVRHRSRSPMLRRRRSINSGDSDRSGGTPRGSGDNGSRQPGSSASPVLRRELSHTPEAARDMGDRSPSREDAAQAMEEADRKPTPPPAWTPDTSCEVHSDTHSDSYSDDD